MAEKATILEQFVERVRAEVQAGVSPGQMQAILSEVLQLPGDCLDLHRQQLSDGPYTQYVLFRASDGTCSMVVVVISPGAALPVHNCGAWALVGIYQGQQRETWFRRLDDGGTPGRAQLRVERTFVPQRGTVKVLPDGQILAMEALSNEPAISIHIYGTDIVAQPRSTFDPEVGTEEIFQPVYVELSMDDGPC
jgi:predicted metal-dependent enzyme (double-stranded beta helix superfamily)